jgi:hypothetical protein
VQAIETSCGNEPRDGIGAALHQDTAHAAARKFGENCRWRELPFDHRQRDNFHAT